MTDYQSRVKTVIVLAVITLSIITVLTLEGGWHGKYDHGGYCHHYSDRGTGHGSKSASAFYPDKKAGYRHIVIRRSC